MFKLKIKIQNEHSLRLRENNEHKVKLRENNEHRLTIKAMMATAIIYVGGEIFYSSKTAIKKAVILARTYLKNSYKSTTSAIGKVFVRIRGGTTYNSSSQTSEKFLVKLSPLPLEGIPLKEYSETLLRNLHNSLKHLSYITSDIYQSFYTSVIEKVLIRLGFKENKYISDSKVFLNGIQARAEGVIDYSFQTLGRMKTWVRGRGVLNYSSKLEASAKAIVRASSSTIYKFVLGVKDILSVKTSAQNKSSSSTEVSREGLNAKMIGQAFKYVSSTSSNAVNKIWTKVKGEGNSFSSKTETDETKMFEYYTVKLSTYQNKKLNENPQGLLRFCYIVDKNWLSVSKVYKTWSRVKERITSWEDLK